uniref:Protein phosphatase n=1 Tax=Alexandrium catenella TaxID=2925 RepID=A0A7S1R8K0_ALECA
MKRDAGYIYADAVACSSRMLGVCDGVSGIQQMGLKPDELPRQLCEECCKAMDHCIAADEVPSDGDGHWLMALLQDAYDQTLAWGATTVLLAAMEDSRRLVVANVGDCGLLVLRPDPSCPSQLSRQFRTDEMRYHPNQPIQVVRLANTAAFDQHRVIMGAKMSMVDLRPGDLIVLGSDGIFDNLRDEEVSSIVQRHCASLPEISDASSPEAPAVCTASRLVPGMPAVPDEALLFGGQPAPAVEQLEAAAKALVDAAISNVSVDRIEQHGDEPAREASQRERPGGNADDTTAIVAVVVEADDIAKADFEVPIQVPRESFRVSRCRLPPGNRGDGWPAGGLLGFAGLIPQCCNTTVDRGDELEEYFLSKDPSKSSPYKPRKDLGAELPAEPERCTIS